MMNARTTISESMQASSTIGLVTCGMICLDNVTAEGQTRGNNDFGRGFKSLVTGRGRGDRLENDYLELSTFFLSNSSIHWLHSESQMLLLLIISLMWH